MKFVLIILGGLLFAFGAFDFAGARFLDIDVWKDHIGWVTMPDILWNYSAYAEMAAGFFIASAGLAGFGGDDE